MNLIRRPGLLLALTLLVAGCAGAGVDTPTTPITTPSTTTTTPTTTTITP